jgi:hypothetical protein
MKYMAPEQPNPQRLKAIVLNGCGHAFDGKTGRSYSVNPVAQVALLLLQDGASRDKVIKTLTGLCSQPESVVAQGVDTFIEQLARHVS